MAKRAKMVEAGQCRLVAFRGAWFCGARHSRHLAKPWRWDKAGHKLGISRPQTAHCRPLSCHWSAVQKEYLIYPVPQLTAAKFCGVDTYLLSLQLLRNKLRFLAQDSRHL